MWQLSDPRASIFALSIVAGLLINLSSMAAQARLLEIASAQGAALISIGAAFVFCFLMPRILNPPNPQIRYARFLSTGLMSILALLFCVGVVVDSVTATPLAHLAAVGAWMFLATFLSEALRLSFVELSNRHVNPAFVGPFYYSLIIGYEIGTIGAAAWILLTDVELLPSHQIIAMTLGIGLVLTAGVLFRFGGFRHVEVRFSRRPLQQSDLVPLTWAIIIPLLLMGTGSGLFRVFQEFQVRTIIKAAATRPPEIMDAILKVYLTGSLITIAVCTFVGRLSFRLRLSPFQVVAVGAVILAGVQVAVTRSQAETAFLWLGAASRGIERGMYAPSIVLLMSFFVGPQRARIRFWHHVMLLSGCGLLFVFFTAIQLAFGFEILGPIAPWITTSSMIAVAGVALSSQTGFQDFFKKSIGAGKVASILGATGLSFVRPRGYPDQMKAILDANPKKLLRKMIILGLGFSRDEKAAEIVMDEFRSDKEEIQLAVIDALSASRSYRGMNFIINVCLTGKNVRSLSVRLNAATLISSLYGKRAIPIIMVGLGDPDPRIVANALEALALFRENEMGSIFLNHLGSSVHRVRANALMGLGLLPRYRTQYRAALSRELTSQITSQLSSYLYVIGRLKDSFFKDRLLEIEGLTRNSEDPVLLQNRRMVAWALTQLKEPLGRDLFWELLEQSATSIQPIDPILHFFAQLNLEDRYDCIQQWLVGEDEPMAKEERIAAILKSSRFDFHFEAEYAFDLATSLNDLRSIKRSNS